MHIEELRIYFLSRSGVDESLPFDDTTLVFKVMGKMFGLISLTDVPPRMNLKCDPELAEELRDEYDCVIPGFHMNKKHWNTVTIDGSVSNDLLIGWIDHSYDTVVAGLTKKLKAELSLIRDNS